MAFEIHTAGDGVVEMIGRCDAAQADALEAFLEQLDSDAVLDLGQLAYISSAGLGILFAAQRRLGESGHSLRLRKLIPHIRDVFEIAGFDAIFDIEESEPDR